MSREAAPPHCLARRFEQRSPHAVHPRPWPPSGSLAGVWLYAASSRAWSTTGPTTATTHGFRRARLPTSSGSGEIAWQAVEAVDGRVAGRAGQPGNAGDGILGAEFFSVGCRCLVLGAPCVLTAGAPSDTRVPARISAADDPDSGPHLPSDRVPPRFSPRGLVLPRCVVQRPRASRRNVTCLPTPRWRSEACSGIRSMVSLLTLGIVAATFRIRGCGCAWRLRPRPFQSRSWPGFAWPVQACWLRIRPEAAHGCSRFRMAGLPGRLGILFAVAWAIRRFAPNAPPVPKRR